MYRFHSTFKPVKCFQQEVNALNRRICVQPADSARFYSKAPQRRCGPGTQRERRGNSSAVSITTRTALLSGCVGKVTGDVKSILNVFNTI